MQCSFEAAKSKKNRLRRNRVCEFSHWVKADVARAGSHAIVLGPFEGGMREMNDVAYDNVQLFRKIIDRGFCQGDLSVADEICATKLSEHEYLAKTDVPGPEILKEQIRDARSSITGLVLTIEDVVEGGGTVWARSRATGSDPRSGKPVSIYVIDICRFENGKLVEHWGVPDRFALLHQIGALPPKPASAR